MLSMMKRSILILALHDSRVVRSGYFRVLRDEIKKAYSRLFRRLTLIASAFVFIILANSSLAKEPGDDASWIYRVVTDSKGEKFVEVKWAIRSIDNIKTIQIPWAYRSLLLGAGEGAQLIDSFRQEDRTRGFGGVFSFSVILPDGGPHTDLDSVSVANNRDGKTAQGITYGTINEKYPTWDERRVFSILPKIEKNNLYTGPERAQIALVSKSPRFGLNRIGPERFVVEEWRKQERFATPVYKDMWFDGDTPENSTSIIVCGSDERFDGSTDPDNGPDHVCEHSFTVEKLTALVKLSYRKNI